MSLEQVKEWKSLKMTIPQISKMTGKSQSTLYHMFKYYGIETNKVEVIIPWNLTQLYDENNIDGQYVIGLLAADGYLDGDTGRVISIWIQEKDVELLCRIKDVMFNRKANINWKDGKGIRQNQVNLNIGSVTLIKYLREKYGFTRHKSSELPFPHHLENPLPFLRGFFDGNGYIGYGCTFSCGSVEFTNGFLKWIKEKYGYTPNVQICGKNKTCMNITFRKKHSEFIHDLFKYSGLQRKTINYQLYLPNEKGIEAEDKKPLR